MKVWFLMVLQDCELKDWVLQAQVEGDWVNQEQGNFKKVLSAWQEDLLGYPVRFLAKTPSGWLQVLTSGKVIEKVNLNRLLV